MRSCRSYCSLRNRHSLTSGSKSNEIGDFSIQTARKIGREQKHLDLTPLFSRSECERALFDLCWTAFYAG